MNSHTVGTTNLIHEAEDVAASGPLDRLVDQLGAASRHVALLAAWIAMCGSLFMSEVLGWVPCVLCWYQRILMYPLAIILAIGIVRRDRGLHLYVLPFSITGIGVSLYHYLLIKTPWLPPPPCTVGIPCTTDYLNLWGFVNVPFLALTAFTIITGMMWAFASLRPLSSDPSENEVGGDDVPASRFGFANLAVIMIIVSVVLAFLLGSTFV
jgi:disulfide bond formation protein DsbB